MSILLCCSFKKGGQIYLLQSLTILVSFSAPVLDDSDVFQCGRCKKQFSSIDVFVNHKTECNNTINQLSDISLPTNVSGIPQNTVVVQKIQVSIGHCIKL